MFYRLIDIELKQKIFSDHNKTILEKFYIFFRVEFYFLFLKNICKYLICIENIVYTLKEYKMCIFKVMFQKYFQNSF